MSTFTERLNASLRVVPDFPKPGILFRDISPLLADRALWEETIAALAGCATGQVDFVVGIESRGFLVGQALASALKVGFVMARKPSKLPGKKHRVQYGLEYGKDALEMQDSAFPAGSRILVADDLLATGGTAKAAAELVSLCGGRVVGYAFIVELDGLGGREKLAACPVASCLRV